MIRYAILAVLLVLLIAPALTLAQTATPQPPVDVRAVNLAFPDIQIDVRVHNRRGQAVTELQPQMLRILEDSQPTTGQIEVTAQIATATTPQVSVTLSDGKKEELRTRGAAIGVVFDATTLLNTGAPAGTDAITAGREAIEQFLGQTAQKAPNDPEIMSLFIPIDSPAQQAQVADFATYTPDRNALINVLRNLVPRTGKTSLYATIQQAVELTGDAALQQGRPAVVLVVSDGGDSISGESFTSIISQANERGVTIISFGVGADSVLIERGGGFQLNQLASSTGGVYVQRPDAAAATAAFDTKVTAAPDSLHTLRYRSGLRDDGRTHQIIVEVALPDGTVTSQPISLNLSGVLTSTSQLAPVNDVLMRQYLLFAVPVALLVSLLIVVAKGAFHWNSSRSLSNSDTRH